MLHRTLEEVKLRSRVAAAKKKDNVSLDFSSTKCRYDYTMRQSKTLKNFMDRSWPGGSTCETSLDVLTFFFDHHLSPASRLFMKFGLPGKIERQVVKAYEDWFHASKACAIRNLIGMTWAGYCHLTSSLFSVMNSTTGKYEPI